MPAIIVENDESQWNDQTGVLYHFPRRYLPILTPGEKVIYYKGRLRDPGYADRRLTPEQHYFGTAEIGRVYPDRDSEKGDNFATIEAYRPFDAAVSWRDENGDTFEPVSKSRATNYWRDGVRQISPEVYDQIIQRAKLRQPLADLKGDVQWPTNELQSGIEGDARQVYTTIHERDPRLRTQALAIHGVSCIVCGFDFETRYGVHGRGFIHIHHLKPIHSFAGAEVVDAGTDLVPLCPNCHAMIHRRKNHTLAIDELRALLRKG